MEKSKEAPCCDDCKKYCNQCPQCGYCCTCGLKDINCPCHKQEEVKECDLKNRVCYCPIQKSPEKGWEGDKLNKNLEEVLNEFDQNFTSEWRWARERLEKPSATDWLRVEVNTLLRQELASQKEDCITDAWVEIRLKQERKSLLVEIRERMPKKKKVQEGRYCGCDGECFSACPSSYNQALSDLENLLKELEK